MGTSNGKIARPVDLRDVAACLGESALDVGALCRSARINKWSRHKPVNISKVKPLTEEDFVGGYDGYYYGLKMSSGLDQLQDLLNMDFEYDGPHGGLESPYRILDFDGYDHFARPNVIGEVLDASYADVNDAIIVSINVDYLSMNTTGVDLGSIILRRPATPEETVATLGNMYPCILIRNLTTGKTFTKAMTYRRTGEYGKLLSSTNAWEVDFSCALYDELKPAGDSDDYRAGVYLSPSIRQEALYDLRDWTEVREGMVLMESFFPVPGLTALDITLRNHSTGYRGVFFGSEDIYIYAQNTPILLSMGVNPAPGDTTVTAELRFGTAVPRQIIFAAELNAQQEYALKDLGLMYVPGNATMEVKASLTIGQNVTTRTYYIHFI